MVNPELPQELLVEIFSRLATKSVGKCRCLSKTWNTNLSDSQFISLHQKTHQQQSLIILSKSGFQKSLITTDVTFSTDVTQLGIWTHLLGSCNGFVLLRKTKNYFQEMVVMNPVTRQQVHIPNSPSIDYEESLGTGYDSGLEDYVYGFGYDCSCDDYKVVELFLFEEQVHVYSMKTRVWKHVGHNPYDSVSNVDMTFVNGAVHWLGKSIYYHISAFDLATESFREVHLPKECKPPKRIYDLVVLQGCLAIVDFTDGGSVDVWVMKEYGVVDSWVRFRIAVNDTWRKIKPVCFVGDEEMLCFITETGMDRWVVYDLKSGIANDVVGGRTHGSSLDCFVFEETLVSPQPLKRLSSLPSNTAIPVNWQKNGISEFIRKIASKFGYVFVFQKKRNLICISSH